MINVMSHILLLLMAIAILIWDLIKKRPADKRVILLLLAFEIGKIIEQTLGG